MSTIASPVIGLLLLLAGLISVVAAILGNPIRLGTKHIPGPNSGPARAVVASIGTASLAACAVVFILNPTQGPATTGTDFTPPMTSHDPSLVQADTGAVSGSVGGLPPLITPTPTGSPKPPVAPSSAPPVPGKPSVTSIKVSAGGVSGCNQTFHASVNVSNGPVTVKYVISVNGYVVGANPRTATVSGTSGNLDDYPVDVQHAGEIAYNILSPTVLSDQKTYSVPSACQPALNVSNLRRLSGPSGSQNCSDVALSFRADLTVSAPPGGMNITYHLEVGSSRQPDRTEYFPAGTTTIGASVSLADNPDGYSITLRYVVTAPVSDSVQATLSGPCTSPAPPPPPPPPPPTTTEPPPATTEPPATTDPATTEPTSDAPSPEDSPVQPVDQESTNGSGGESPPPGGNDVATLEASANPDDSSSPLAAYSN